VRIDDTLLADTTRAIELCERGYPPRQYVPSDDVRMGLLTPSETVTTARSRAMPATTPLASTRTWRGVMNNRSSRCKRSPDVWGSMPGR
jgi:hypothetical protein